MIEKEKAETILAEIKQQIQSGNTESIAFSSHTILWMAESLVEAIGEVEKNETALKEVTAQKEQAVAKLEILKEDYFKLTQDIRKAEIGGIALNTKEKLLKKWGKESK